MDLIKQIKTNKLGGRAVKKYDEDLVEFFNISVVNEFGKEYILDISEILKYEIKDLNQLEKLDLVVSLERIASIQASIAMSLKYLTSKLENEEIEFRIWKAGANDFGIKKYYDFIADTITKKNLIKGLFKAPSREDIEDGFLNDIDLQGVYYEYRKNISSYKERLQYLKHIYDILNSRAIAIQTILKYSDSQRYGKDYD